MGLTKARLIAFAVFVVLIAGGISVYNYSKQVNVDALLTGRPDEPVTIRLFKGEATPESELQAAPNSPLLADLRRLLDDGRPEWRWSGYRPRLADDPYRIDLVTSRHTIRVSESGMLYIIDAQGHGRSVVTSRAYGLRERIASLFPKLPAQLDAAK